MDTLPLLVVTFAGWSSLYWLCGLLTPKLAPEWHCRMVTTLHAVVVVTLSSWSAFVQGPCPFTEPGGTNTWLQNQTIILCLAYFVFDFIWCLYHKTEGAFMIFHHLLSITGNSLSLHYNIYGTELVATIFGTEVTNPLLQLRWFLRKTGRGSEWYAEINDLCFMALFGIMRIVLGGYLLYSYVLHPRPDWLGKVGGVSIYSVGWVFWVMIVKYAVKKYAKMWKNLAGNVELNGGHQNGNCDGIRNQNGSMVTKKSL